MDKPPAFQFYPKDFLSDINVSAMDMEERGIYITLLCYCWLEDGIPKKSRMVKKWLKNGSPLCDCFYEKDGKLRNKRLDKERQKQIAWAKKSSKGGKISQKKRWGDIKKESRSTRLKRAREKGTHSNQEWQIMQEICDFKCVRCGVSSSDLDGERLCKDHIIPICKGGDDSINNIQPICRNCNTAKTNEQIDYRPVDWREKLIKKLSTNRQPIVNQSPTLQSSSSSSIPNIKKKYSEKEKYNNIQKKWNDFANKNDLPKIRELSKTRIGKINARLKEKDFDLDLLFKNIEEQPFLLGENKQGWTIDFDWVFQKNNYLKIMEMKYKNRKKAGTMTPEEQKAYDEMWGKDDE